MHNLGNLYFKLKLYDKSIESLSKAIDINGDNKGQLLSYYLLVKVNLAIQNYINARIAYDAGLKLLDNKLSSLNIKYRYLYYRLNESELDIEFIRFLLDEAIPHFENNEVDYAKECLIIIANHYENRRCYKEANFYLKKALQL